MDKYLETFQTWNKIAKAYEEKFMNLSLYDASYQDFVQALPAKNARVLDLGCGPGNITKYLLLSRPSYRIHGIDVAPQMLQIAKENNPGATFSLLDVRALHTHLAKYDGIIAGFCLPYLSSNDVELLFRSSFDNLEAGGAFYVSFVPSETERSGFQTGSNGLRAFFYYHQPETLLRYAQNIGYRLIKQHSMQYARSEQVEETHTALILKKPSNEP